MSIKSKILLYVFLTGIVLTFSAIFFISASHEGIYLFALLFFIMTIGIFAGPTASLGASLILYFFIGSILFWSYLTDTFSMHMEISFLHLLIWTVVLLIGSIFSGRVSTLVKKIDRENQMLVRNLNSLVAIDPITGFDNRDRMFMELELEYRRSERYGTPFVFLLVKINHLDEFRKLYGEKEFESLLKHLAENIFRAIRISDLKFRVEKDLFGILLTNTPGDDVEIVMRKLEQELSVFQLTNRNYIDLTITFGYAVYPGDYMNSQEIYETAKEEVSFYEA